MTYQLDDERTIAALRAHMVTLVLRADGPLMTECRTGPARH